MADVLLVSGHLLRCENRALHPFGDAKVLDVDFEFTLAYVEVRCVLLPSFGRLVRIWLLVFVVDPVEVKEVSYLDLLHRPEEFAGNCTYGP